MADDDDLVAVQRKLVERAAQLGELIVEGPIHPHVRAAVQRAAASLRACSELRGEVDAARDAYIDKARQRDEAHIGSGESFRLMRYYGSLFASLHGASKLDESIKLIADERDIEALRALGEQVLETALKIGMTLSGVEVIKAVKEFVDAGLDLYRAGQQMKYRKNQVKFASNLLLWLDVVCLACLNWGVAAQFYLLGARGKGDVDDDTVIAMVTERIAAVSRR